MAEVIDRKADQDRGDQSCYRLAKAESAEVARSHFRPAQRRSQVLDCDREEYEGEAGQRSRCIKAMEIRIEIGHQHRKAGSQGSQEYRESKSVAVRDSPGVDSQGELENQRYRNQDTDLECTGPELDCKQRHQHAAAAQSDAVQDVQQGDEVDGHGKLRKGPLETCAGPAQASRPAKNYAWTENFSRDRQRSSAAARQARRCRA